MQTVHTSPENGARAAALARYRPWLYAAAIYNLVWGATTVVFPEFFFRLVGMPSPTHLPLWQVLGMYVLVFAPGYWWAARYPERHSHLVLIGLLGKTLGPIGFVWAVLKCQPAPLLLGFVLGPLMEENLRRAMLISRGDPTVFFTRPISLSFMIVTGLILLIMVLPAVRAKREAITD